MRIGDKVRFLNQTGGGIVVGFGKKGYVTIEDEDGFEIPFPEKECVVIEENIVEKEGKRIQTKDGEKLNIALLYTKQANKFACTLANESNYNLLVTYTTSKKDEYYTLFAGEVLPYDKKELFSFGKDELNEFSKKVIVRIIPYKLSIIPSKLNKHTLKALIERDFILEPTNLLKDSMFKDNEFISTKAYCIQLINESLNNNPLNELSINNKVKQALVEKFEDKHTNNHTAKAKQGTQNKAFVNGKWIEIPNNTNKRNEIEDNALIKFSKSGIMEVDLHADALLETTAGMDNTAILKYQIEKFHQAMNAAKKQKGQKIVFIHGKGDGVLRKALLQELKTKYNRCKWQDASFKEYGFGATMVTLS